MEENADPQVQYYMNSFKEATEKCLGANLTCSEIEEVGIPDTPEYLWYVDKDQNEVTFPDWDEEFTPEVGDEYVHASITLLEIQFVMMHLKSMSCHCHYVDTSHYTSQASVIGYVTGFLLKPFLTTT